MISESKYNSWLKERFINKNRTLFSEAVAWKENYKMFEETKSYRQLLRFLDIVENKYEFNMQRMCGTNFQLLSLFQTSFQGRVVEENRKVALEFLIACCFTDKILDSRRFSKRKQLIVAEKMADNWGMEEEKGELFLELDGLLADVRKHLDSGIIEENRLYLHSSIAKAFESEIYMWEHCLLAKEGFRKDGIHLLVDKSVEFEKAALLLAIDNSFSVAAVETAETIAEITWLADDICDFIDDIRQGRKNSLLFYNLSEREMPIEERAKLAIIHMDENVKKLEHAIGSLRSTGYVELYYFVMNLVWKWFSEMRK